MFPMTRNVFRAMRNVFRAAIKPRWRRAAAAPNGHPSHSPGPRPKDEARHIDQALKGRAKRCNAVATANYTSCRRRGNIGHKFWAGHY